MALPPKYAGLKLTPGNNPAKNLHTIELYLDYVCPFSAKQFKTLYTFLNPNKTTSGASQKTYTQNIQFIFRPQIQPWHPSSTLVHESALAVQRLSPGKFWDYSEKLMERQKEYFDVSVVGEGRNGTYGRLSELGGEVGVDEKGMMELLRVSEKPAEDGSLNTGNKVQDDVKYCVKEGRLRGIHVSPTVVFNGIVEPSISSSFSAEDWDKWLEKNCS